MKTITISALFAIALLTMANFQTGEIQTEVSINASNEAVWQVLQNFDNYEQWNPFIREISGDLKEGDQLIVNIDNGASGKMTFKPTIKRMEVASELRWVGHLGFPGLFDGEHYFKLEQSETGGARLIHGETFSGVLTPLLFPLIKQDTTLGFEKMNAALKKMVESV